MRVGNNISVTGENRELYVQKLTQYLLHDSVEQQFAQLKSGFYKVVGSSILLECMRPDELELLMVLTTQLTYLPYLFTHLPYKLTNAYLLTYLLTYLFTHSLI